MKTIEIIEEMFLVYVRSEEFGTLSVAGRNDLVTAYEELKLLAIDEK